MIFNEEKMREDLYDPQDDSERFRSRQPGDNFDLDQDIYDRNPDWDVDESAKSSSVLDYSEAAYKMDKFMPNVPDLQDEYYEILGSGDVDALEEFLELNADEENGYAFEEDPRNGTLRVTVPMEMEEIKTDYVPGGPAWGVRNKFKVESVQYTITYPSGVDYHGTSWADEGTPISLRKR